MLFDRPIAQHLARSYPIVRSLLARDISTLPAAISATQTKNTSSPLATIEIRVPRKARRSYATIRDRCGNPRREIAPGTSSKIDIDDQESRRCKPEGE
jgi:hypothetical protein